MTSQEGHVQCNTAVRMPALLASEKASIDSKVSTLISEKEVSPLHEIVQSRLQSSTEYDSLTAKSVMLCLRSTGGRVPLIHESSFRSGKFLESLCDFVCSKAVQKGTTLYSSQDLVRD